MTDHDRNDQDRTGDDRVPNWGEGQRADSPDQARYDQPRYDEARDDQPRYGERAPEADAPRYGERSAEGHTPQYGAAPYEQSQHDQHQYGQQPYAASSAPASAGAPSWQGYEEPKRKKRTVGVVAFVVALIALVLAVVAGIVFGNAFGGNSAIRESILNGSAATQSGQRELQERVVNDPNLLTGSAGAGIATIIGTVLGLWAIVQGIIAIVAKRGRAFGVIALIVAVVSPIVLYVAFAASLGANLS